MSDIQIGQLDGDQDPDPTYNTNLKIKNMVGHKTRNINSCTGDRSNKSFSNISSKSGINAVREMKSFKKLSKNCSIREPNLEYFQKANNSKRY